MSIKKRILPLLLILALVPSLMAVPAAASDASSSYINLLDSVTYKISNALTGSSEILYSPQFNFYGTEFIIEWFPTWLGKLESIYINFNMNVSGSVFSSLKLGDFSGSLVNATDTFLQYKFDVSSWDNVNLNSGLVLTGTFSSMGTREFSIDSCYGIEQGSYVYDGMVQFDVYNHEASASGSLIVKPVTSVTDYFPWNYRFTFIDSIDQLGRSALRAYYHVYLTGEHLDSNFLDTISLTFATFNGINEVGASVTKAGSGAPISVLPVISVSSCEGSNSWRISTDDTYTQYKPIYYTYVFDASGWDFSEYNILFSLDLDDLVVGDWLSDVHGYQVYFSNLKYTLPRENLPWYSQFARWISGQFDRVLDAINGNGSELDQAGDAMSSQADTMQQANDQMAAVERPAIDPDNLLGNLLNFSPGGMVVLSSMTSNNFVPQLMVVVFTFALCGYIFFGKRR